MSETVATAGNKGSKVRSDCFVTLVLKDTGGIQVSVQSKVKALYEKAMVKLCVEVLHFYDIEHADVTLEDSGALPLVQAARLEAAVRQLKDIDKPYLLPFLEANDYPATKEQYRFSRLYLPGNTPSMMLNAGIHHPHGIILDLEDSVAFDKKEEARIMVRNALRGINFYGAERMVRINQFPKGLEDLAYIIPNKVHTLLVPKCEAAEQVHQLEEHIEQIKKQHDITDEVFLMPIIESAMGVEKAFEIATASPRVVALAIGLEDYTADLGTRRTQDAWESFYARTRIVNACKAAKIQAIDSVYSDVGNMDGLRDTVATSKSLGFEGMGCIHPRQIQVIHECYAPNNEEIDYAKKVVHAFMEAKEKGLGVVSLGTKMIDPPVVKRANRILELALAMDLVEQNWREEFIDD